MVNFRIISWNFGEQKEDKLKCIFENAILNLDTSGETIFVIGLQEVNKKEIPVIKAYFDKQFHKQFPADKYTTIMIQKGSGTFFGSGFDLLTFIIYPKNITIADSGGESKSVPSEDTAKGILSCAKGRLSCTKGYLWTTLKINGKEVTLVNIHLPFQDEAFSIKNFDMLNKQFSEESNVIIFGDFNSRSTVDDTCLSVNDKCDVKYKKNAEGNLSGLQGNLRTCADPSTKTTLDCDAITNKLTTNDLLLKEMEKIMPGYKEARITFPPSYKIDPKSGMYELTGKKQRLSGYADRILVKGDDLTIQDNTYKKQDNTYKKLGCKGNDHFPVLLDVTMSIILTENPLIEYYKKPDAAAAAVAAAGGKRKTRRKRRKIKKTKSRKNRRKSTRR